MINERTKQYTNTPKSINNYNNFLINMDKNFSYKSNQNNEYIYLQGFTGQTNNDIILSKIEINDPNNYSDDIIPPKFVKTRHCNHYNKSICKNIDTDNINSVDDTKFELVNIEVEIKHIEDILLLIEKYKIEPTIKYNINMQILHNIKEPLIELNNMIGMKEIKINIVDQILYFIQGLHKNNKNSTDFMHTVIYGPPGTGKTEVAKIMGKIYSKIGVLSKGTFKKVTRNDLIAGFLGQTAIKTKDVIKDAIGGVLFIDEAYSLGNDEKKDSFSKECIDTLCESLSDNKDDLMVIIAGYERELNECFFNYNKGLESRFVWRFNIDNYSAEDLYNIFIKKVNDIEWTINIDSINAGWFKKNMNHLTFFGRNIETVLAKTKISHSKRVFCKPENDKKIITLQDLNNGFEMYLKNKKQVEQPSKMFQSIYI
jgi:SpoVK/Ycf46/Vps4 family AAA+-type ATPase